MLFFNFGAIYCIDGIAMAIAGKPSPDRHLCKYYQLLGRVFLLVAAGFDQIELPRTAQGLGYNLKYLYIQRLSLHKPSDLWRASMFVYRTGVSRLVAAGIHWRLDKL
jgi:hypothetical protein